MRSGRILRPIRAENGTPSILAQDGLRDHFNNVTAMLTLAPTLLLLSADEALKDFVATVVQPPWNLAHHAIPLTSPEVFARPNVRLVVLDDENVEENERGRLLTQIGRHVPTTPLIYLAARQSDANERRARTNGAHYYTSKPISPAHLESVLQSFMRAQK
jgi:DNA-binding response OmpR family regulator